MEASAVTSHSMVPRVLEDGNYETWSSFMEDYLVGQDLWDVVTQPKPDEETVIATSDSESWKNIIKSWSRNNALALHAIKMSCGPKFLPLVLKSKSSKEAWDLLASAANPQPGAEEDKRSRQEDDTDNIVEDVSNNIVEERPNENKTDYSPFVKAIYKKDWRPINEEDWRPVEMFIDKHPEALAATLFHQGGTALHYAVYSGKEDMTIWLIERMTTNDLEILDEYGYTALARAAEKDHPDLQELMIKKNPRLPNVGGINRIPVHVACLKGDEKSTRFLYNVTDKKILSPECGELGVRLLSLCLRMEIYGTIDQI